MLRLALRMLTLLCLPLAAWGEGEREFRILYINSYSATYGWSNNVLAGFRQKFQGQSLPVSIQCYDLDVFSKHGLKPAAADVELLRQVLRSSDFDLLVTADNPATDLFLSGAVERPRETPVLFTGYNCAKNITRSPPSGMIGIAMPQTILANIKLGMRLWPGTDTVAVILDGGADGQNIYRCLKQALDKTDHPQVRIFCGAHYSTRELLAELAKLPDNTLLIYQNWRSTSPEPYQSPREILTCIVEANPEKPLLFTRPYCFESVPSGGVVIDGFALGVSTAQLAGEILKGTPLKRLQSYSASMRPQFDYAFLTKYQLDQEDLPGNTLIRNNPQPFMIRYRGEIIGFFAIFPLLLGVGGVWLWRSRRERARLEAMFSQIPIRGGIVDANEKGRFFFSPNMGMKPDGNHTVFDYLSEEMRQRLRECFYQVLRDGEDRSLQYLAQGRTRSITFHRLSRQLFGVDCVVWVSQDIEELTAARRSAEYVARNFELAVNNISEGVITTDDNEVILYANPKSAELAGCSTQDLLGRKFSDVLHLNRETGDGRLEFPVRDALREQTPVTMLRDLELVAEDGTRHPIAGSTAPILEENGKCRGTVSVFRDISDQRRFERVLGQRNQQLCRNIEQEKVLNRCLEIITAEQNIDSATADVLRLICWYLHADHCVLFRYDEEAMRITPFAQYRVPGISQALPSVPLAMDAPWYSRFERREPILMSAMGELEELGLEEQRQAFLEYGIKSICGVGVLHGNRLWGHLCVCFQKQEHEFTRSEQQFLLAVGHIFELLISGRSSREQLRRSEYEKSMVLNALSFPVMLWDANGKTVFCNTAALALKCLTLEQALEYPCHEVFCGKNPPPEDCPMRKAFRDGREHSRIISAHGSRFLVTARPLFENGVLSYVLASAIDLEHCAESAVAPDAAQS